MNFAAMMGSWCNDVDSVSSRSRRRSITNHYTNRKLNTKSSCPVGTRCNGMYLDMQGNRPSCSFHGSILHDNSRTIILQPIRRERVVEVMVEEIQERVIHVPTVEYVDKFVQVIKPVLKYKIRQVKRPVIKEKIKNVTKVVEEEKIVHVPEYQYVDKYVDVPTVVEKEKIVEVPIPIVKERLVPKLNILTRERIQELDTVEFQLHESGEAHFSERRPQEPEVFDEDCDKKNTEAIDSNAEEPEERADANNLLHYNTEYTKEQANETDLNESACATDGDEVAQETGNNASSKPCAQGDVSDHNCSMPQESIDYSEVYEGGYVNGGNDVSIEVETFQQDYAADSTLCDRSIPDEFSGGAYTTLDILYKNVADLSISAHEGHCGHDVTVDQAISVSDGGTYSQAASINFVGSTIKVITHQGGDANHSSNRQGNQNSNAGHGTSTTTLYAHLDYTPRATTAGRENQSRGASVSPQKR